MTVLTLKQEIASRLHDPASQIVTDQQLLTFINAAARDADVADWLVELEEDESLTLATATYNYNVPANFAIITEIKQEGATSDLYDVLVLPHKWALALNGGVPIIRFNSTFFTITNGKKLKLIGFKKPVTYTEDTDTVDVGIESFLRERATSYGAADLGRSTSGWARSYEQLFQDSFAVSESLLAAQKERQRERLAQFLVARQV